MQQISDAQWQCSAKGRGLEQSSKSQDFEWNARNVAEIPPPKPPVEILERAFEMLAKTFDVFDFAMTEPTLPRHKERVVPSAPVAKTNGSLSAGDACQHNGQGGKIAPVVQMKGRCKAEKAPQENGQENINAPLAPVPEINGHHKAEEMSQRNGQDENAPAAPVARMNGDSKADEVPQQNGREAVNAPATQVPKTTINNTAGASQENRSNIQVLAKTWEKSMVLPIKKAFPINRELPHKRSSVSLFVGNSSDEASVRTLKRAKTNIQEDHTVHKPANGIRNKRTAHQEQDSSSNTLAKEDRPASDNSSVKSDRDRSDNPLVQADRGNRGKTPADRNRGSGGIRSPVKTGQGSSGVPSPIKRDRGNSGTPSPVKQDRGNSGGSPVKQDRGDSGIPSPVKQSRGNSGSSPVKRSRCDGVIPSPKLDGGKSNNLIVNRVQSNNGNSPQREEHGISPAPKYRHSPVKQTSARNPPIPPGKYRTCK